MSLDALSSLLERSETEALLGLATFVPPSSERLQAAALALRLGRPRLAVRWAEQTAPLLHAAALLRLGERRAVLTALEGQPETARVAVLQARALGTLQAAELARTLARREGDSPALIAVATLLGELLLPSDPRAALRALAEGLKVSELLNEGTDPLLLAVLSLVQARIGGEAKAGKTARKALDLSLPRSPARVLALLALGRPEDAQAERTAGELVLDFGPFLPQERVP